MQSSIAEICNHYRAAFLCINYFSDDALNFGSLFSSQAQQDLGGKFKHNVFLHYLKELGLADKVCAVTASQTCCGSTESVCCCILPTVWCMKIISASCVTRRCQDILLVRLETGDVYMLHAISLHLQTTANIIHLNSAMLQEKYVGLHSSHNSIQFFNSKNCTGSCAGFIRSHSFILLYPKVQVSCVAFPMISLCVN